MAKLKANDVGLYVNTGTTAVPVWKLVVCLTDTNIDLAVEEVNGDSKCGIDREAGDGTWTSSFEGFYKVDPLATEVSAQELITYAQGKQTKEWKAANPDETYYRGFTGYISSYGEGAPYNEYVSISAEINISGDLITTAP